MDGSGLVGSQERDETYHRCQKRRGIFPSSVGIATIDDFQHPNGVLFPIVEQINLHGTR
jgi:hypothetical protein